jgi:hypothetical protein
VSAFAARLHWTGLAIGLAAGVLVACGGDDTVNPPPGPDASANDSGTPRNDGSTPGVDASHEAGAPLDGGDGGRVGDGGGDAGEGGDAGDAGEGGCNFATFVKGLVAADTTMHALPSTDLGQECTDDQNQAEFQSLFP